MKDKIINFTSVCHFPDIIKVDLKSYTENPSIIKDFENIEVVGRIKSVIFEKGKFSFAGVLNIDSFNFGSKSYYISIGYRIIKCEYKSSIRTNCEIDSLQVLVLPIDEVSSGCGRIEIL